MSKYRLAHPLLFLRTGHGPVIPTVRASPLVEPVKGDERHASILPRVGCRSRSPPASTNDPDGAAVVDPDPQPEASTPTQLSVMTPSGWKDKANQLLLDRDASGTDHPGGNLDDHLCRVSRLLADWGSREGLQAAGLCHTCYGTDGFAVALLELAERPLLTEAIGREAE